jgi:hypothetical protein
MRKTKQPRPPGGTQFEAVQCAPDGWLVLAPWVQTPDGHWWRPHLDLSPGYSGKHQAFAEHYAAAINAAMRGEG